MTNFDAWIVHLIEVATEKKCLNMPTEEPGNNQIRKNHDKNIQMFFNKTICESLKNVSLDSNELDTYNMLISIKPDCNLKRLEILKDVSKVVSSDITEYVIIMQTIQKKLKDIEMNAEHHETRPAAHMNQLLENLSEDQTKNI